MAFVPITTYFTTIHYVFEGEPIESETARPRGFPEPTSFVGNATYAAIAAIVSANIVMVAYVVVAFNEDAGPALTKKTQ